ncbi:hypothetical protein B0T24DRAFT_685171 [Lasiosphaeria ovina]|uniref:Uncharacterized protein n=1 Tax=Lasiosphaeria ovina TaxID=92902 RepID=A0AAE0JTX2_9PEZI|nr:hypothetical protein B0T24DRAFT_685171 [Lasiosphaeria ovina]
MAASKAVQDPLAHQQSRDGSPRCQPPAPLDQATGRRVPSDSNESQKSAKSNSSAETEVVSVFSHTVKPPHIIKNHLTYGYQNALFKTVAPHYSRTGRLRRLQSYNDESRQLSHRKAVARPNLLRLVRSIMDGCESLPPALSTSADRQLRVLFDAIQRLADKDPAVLVRNLASELVRSHIDIGQPECCRFRCRFRCSRRRYVVALEVGSEAV